jgi:hypothetical protein
MDIQRRKDSLARGEIHVDDLMREDFTCNTCDRLDCPDRWHVMNTFGLCSKKIKTFTADGKVVTDDAGE